MFTNQESAVINEIVTLLKSLGANTARLEKIVGITLDYKALPLDEKQKIEAELLIKGE